MKKCILFSLLIFFCGFRIPVFSQLFSTSYGTDAGHLGSFCTSIGYKAGDVTSATGSFNSFVGYHSGVSNSSGTNNCYFGARAGQDNTTGSSNVFIGFSAGQNSTSASSNVFIGYQTGQLNGSGNSNVFVGYSSGQNNTGNSNVFIGSSAGQNETGSNKLYIENSNSSTPLIYGDFSSDKVGINSLPNSTHTLTVGGTIHSTGLYVNGVPVSGDMSLWNRTGNNVFTISTSDNIGIGTTLANNPNSYKLAVNGKIGAKEVQIENTSTTWADYVFKPDYKLMSLEEVEAFVKKNQHLPEIPSAKDIEEHGHKLGEMDVLLLKKVEELTLYVIELKKEIEELKKGKK